MTNSERLDRSSLIARRLALGTKIQDLQEQFNALRADLDRIYLKNQFLLVAPTLAISGTKTKVKSSTVFSALVGGAVQAKSADTDMAVLAGTLATAKYAAWAFDIDSSGTLTTVAGTMDQTSAAAAVAALAAVADNKVRIGHIVVANTSGSNFVGATTNLDATGIAVTYVPATAVAAMGASAVDTLDG